MSLLQHISKSPISFDEINKTVRGYFFNTPKLEEEIEKIYDEAIDKYTYTFIIDIPALFVRFNVSVPLNFEKCHLTGKKEVYLKFDLIEELKKPFENLFNNHNKLFTFIKIVSLLLYRSKTILEEEDLQSVTYLIFYSIHTICETEKNLMKEYYEGK